MLRTMSLPHTWSAPIPAWNVALKATFRSVRISGVAALVLLVGCEWYGRGGFLAKCDREIRESTQDIDAARDDAQRAQAHSARGTAYSEKARYSKSFKLISSEEYVRLFDLAIADHDRAVALAPGDARVYLARGLAYYWRAVLEDRADPRAASFFQAAKADFTRAVERDPRNEQAFDMRGLVHTAIGDHDQAIRDFAEVAKLDPRLGKMRLADAYCGRGDSDVKAKNYDLAISDYEKAIEFDAPSDGCDCQPDSPLAWAYLETGQVEKSWAAVHRAQRAHRWILPELIERLKKVSGRDG